MHTGSIIGRRRSGAQHATRLHVHERCRDPGRAGNVAATREDRLAGDGGTTIEPIGRKVRIFTKVQEQQQLEDAFRDERNAVGQRLINSLRPSP